jgi:AhpD family alkylhydroperoxidase
MRDFATRFWAITRAQIELIAGRISAINQCAY